MTPLMDSSAQQNSPGTVLLVEDNSAHAELVVRSFEEHQVANHIFHVSDGEEALDYLFRRGAYVDPVRSPRPCVVLLDLRLPKMTGLDVLQEVRRSPDLHALPVIILTTSSAYEDMNTAYARHANSYVTKPVNFENFSHLMKDLGMYWLGWNECPAI